MDQGRRAPDLLKKLRALPWNPDGVSGTHEGLKAIAAMIHSESIQVSTRGRGTVELTDQIQGIVAQSGVDQGICTVFVHHTSASLIICENADPSVRSDLERYTARLVPDGDPIFRHTLEGPDDMPAHVRSILTQTSLSIPVARGRCDLGTWQGIFLWEHRTHPHRRRVTVSVMGERD